MSLLLDSGVWVAGALPDEPSHADARALIEPNEDAAVLDLTSFEVASVLGVTRDRPERARSMLDTISTRCGEEGVVRVDAALAVAALDHSRLHGLTAYGAAYVAVAESSGWTLVSTDVRDLVSMGLAVTPDAAV